MQTYLILTYPRRGLYARRNMNFKQIRCRCPVGNIVFYGHSVKGGYRGRSDCLSRAESRKQLELRYDMVHAGRALARLLGARMSVRYTRSALDSLKEQGWILSIPMSGNRRRYRLVHHLCDKEDVPVDRDGKPLKFAVPRGDGGPFERLYARDISWKACLVWIVHKLYSDWKTGETYPYTTGFCEMLSPRTRHCL